MTQYNNPIPVAVAIIPVRCKGGVIRVIALERAIEPKIGELALPGGYVNEGEHIEVAVAREVFEETGMNLAPSDFQLFTSRITPSNKVLVFSIWQGPSELTEADFEALKPTSEARWFKLIGPREKLAFPLHEEAMEEFWNTL